MKHIFSLCLIVFITQSNIAQIGIGTTTPDPSAMLDVSSTDKGLLVPRLTNANIAAIENPAQGLIVYNIDTNAFQFNSGTSENPSWSSISQESSDGGGNNGSSNVHKSLKYSNTDTNTNVNVNEVSFPVFGTLEWNDDSSLFSVNQSDQSITVNQAGTYRIIANASMTVSSSLFNYSAPEFRLLVNGEEKGSYGSTGFVIGSSGHNESSIHLNEMLALESGDVLTVEFSRSAASGTATLRSEGSSNFYIEQL
ncbi:MAG: hypothetical protein BM564_10655 [Bacteroidetes bacterium MedPE-SWsnd-G2]|nr:MAG: hypothetical protein BM564_10655 [Bacteroidetes bacterium MedPE-SWsnd-G2]